MFREFMQFHVTTNNQSNQAFSELRDTMNKISTQLNTLEKRKFPTQPQPNPQVYRQQQQLVHNVLGDAFESTKAVITLSSKNEVSHPEIPINRQIVTPTPEVIAERDKGKEKSNEASSSSKKSGNKEDVTVKEYQPVVPYPQRLTSGHKNKYHIEIQEIFKQVEINIPLLDAIQQLEAFDEKLSGSEGQFLEIDGSPHLLDASYTSSWCKPTFEAIDLPEIMKSSKEEIPTLELKPLPEELKYVFLGLVEGTFPVVISSHLTLKQETELLQEFDITIRDKKDVKNVVVDHLSHLQLPDVSVSPSPLNDDFPDERLFAVSHASWFADIVNYLVTNRMPEHWLTQDKPKFHAEINFSLDDAKGLRKLQVCELEESRREAYDNARLAKERMKLHVFPGKLKYGVTHTSLKKFILMAR
ncbi:uncharacterized protein LOC131163395 [Malania oleifera]|uniref:uncharacterized protein LOC131163395 n=1 Tax=Malania oleifera TaxID=397392 RepID=UPI0025AEAB6C|nr:uncharacterized protein LOC131163395 [Malania oleifera]